MMKTMKVMRMIEMKMTAITGVEVKIKDDDNIYDNNNTTS